MPRLSYDTLNPSRGQKSNAVQSPLDLSKPSEQGGQQKGIGTASACKPVYKELTKKAVSDWASMSFGGTHMSIGLASKPVYWCIRPKSRLGATRSGH
jgi:hypothetical protein